MRFASSTRVGSSQPAVIVRKIGASPGGLTTGSSAPTINRIALPSWEKSDRCIISNLQVALQCMLRLQPVGRFVTRLPATFFKEPASHFTDNRLRTAFCPATSISSLLCPLKLQICWIAKTFHIVPSIMSFFYNILAGRLWRCSKVLLNVRFRARKS